MNRLLKRLWWTALLLPAALCLCVMALYEIWFNTARREIDSTPWLWWKDSK